MKAVKALIILLIFVLISSCKNNGVDKEVYTFEDIKGPKLFQLSGDNIYTLLYYK